MNAVNVPLASIDETDYDVDVVETKPTVDDCATDDFSKKFFNYSTNTARLDINQLNDFALSPASDDFTPARVTPTTQDADDFGDTGFFSSSISSSKRSSIDIDNSSQFNSLYSSQSYSKSTMSGQSDKCRSNEFKNHVEYDDHDLIDELLGDNFIKDSDEDKVFSHSSPQMSASLEDLVNSFDEKVKSCLRNFEENVSTLAPVQVRSQEEVIKDRPAWWTLTGNYGNILPIDWAKLSPEESNGVRADSSSGGNSLLADDIDEAMEDEKLKQLINSCLDLNSTAPVKSADEVLEEIDAMMSGKIGAPTVNSHDQQSLSSESSLTFDVPIVRRLSFYRFSLDKLKSFSVDQLQDLYEDLELKVQKNSEFLINKLALRDELEFEKEVKNTFLSLLLKIQSRRKDFFQNQSSNWERNNLQRQRYLTTVIPYQKDQIANNIPALQALIKILKAMVDDSPAVPTMLTDYILKFICPTGTTMNFEQNLNTTNNNSSSNNSRKTLKFVPQSLTLSLNTNSLNNTFRAAKRSFSFSRKPTTESSSTSAADQENNNCFPVDNANQDKTIVISDQLNSNIVIV